MEITVVRNHDSALRPVPPRLAGAVLTVARDALVDVPQRVAVCPYCGGRLSLCCTGWTQLKNGAWMADLIDIGCVTEPDIDDELWDDWTAEHCDMPYVYMLPVEEKVMRWLKRNYRFAA